MSFYRNTEEFWKDIIDFSNYEISTLGRIYNKRRDMFMIPSNTQFGHIKISLVHDWECRRYTLSVAKLVAEAFIKPPHIDCKQIVLLDGDLSNVVAYNIVWRPIWYAWKYVRQLKTKQPRQYENLKVRNIDDDVIYDSIVEAGMKEGLLFEDIWRSTYSGDRIYPYGAIFEIIE